MKSCGRCGLSAVRILINLRSECFAASSEPKVCHIHLKPSGVDAAANCLTLPDRKRPRIFGNALEQTLGFTVSISSARTNDRLRPMMRDQFSKLRHRIFVSPPGRCNTYSGNGDARKVYGISYCSRKLSKSFCQISRMSGPVGSMTQPIKPWLAAARCRVFAASALVFPAP